MTERNIYMNKTTCKDEFDVLTQFDIFSCKLASFLHGRGFIPKRIQKLSRQRYPEMDTLAKYYAIKYLGMKIGKYTTGWKQFVYERGCLARIGSFCTIAKNVHLTEGNHPQTYISVHQFLYSHFYGFVEEDKPELLPSKNGKVIIGNDVWIGRDVTILPSVEIGDGAIIGTGAVVNKNIPPYAIAVGVPAKVIKYRFSKEIIQQIEHIKWWDWEDKEIRENIGLFTDPKEFIRIHSDKGQENNL